MSHIVHILHSIIQLQLHLVVLKLQVALEDAEVAITAGGAEDHLTVQKGVGARVRTTIILDVVQGVLVHWVGHELVIRLATVHIGIQEHCKQEQIG